MCVSDQGVPRSLAATGLIWPFGPPTGVILFAVYAVVVWFFALRYRRRWPAFVMVPVAALAVFWLNAALTRVGLAAGGFNLLLLGEAAIVLIGGLFIAFLPRPPAHPHCHYCHYDLRGHDDFNTATFVCPECGHPADGYASLRRTGARWPSCTHCAASLKGMHREADLGYFCEGCARWTTGTYAVPQPVAVGLASSGGSAPEHAPGRASQQHEHGQQPAQPPPQGAQLPV